MKPTKRGWTNIYFLKIFNKKLADKTPKIRHKIVDEAKNEVFKKSAKSGDKKYSVDETVSTEIMIGVISANFKIIV
jgi:c-di-AMP phosphodiesterase-like protein